MWNHRRLRNLCIQNIESQIDLANSSEDLIKIIEETRNMKGLLCVYSFDYLLYFGLTSATLGASLYFFSKMQAPFLLFLICLSIFILLVLTVRLSAWQKRLANLSQKIYYRDLLFDHQLTPLKSSQQFSLSALRERFSEFLLGNHTAEIKTLIQGTYQGVRDPFPFYYYHFAYSIEKFSSAKDYKHAADMVGKPIFQRHHRYGIMIPFDAPATLTITKRRLPLEQRQWQYQDKTLPASFRAQFSLHTSNPQFAQRFLNPLVISLIESLAKSFKSINIEINGRKELLFSFSDKELLTGNRQHSLQNIAPFLLEIRTITKLPKLEMALATLYRITKDIH